MGLAIYKLNKDEGGNVEIPVVEDEEEDMIKEITLGIAEYYYNRK